MIGLESYTTAVMAIDWADGDSPKMPNGIQVFRIAEGFHQSEIRIPRSVLAPIFNRDDVVSCRRRVFMFRRYQRETVWIGYDEVAHVWWVGLKRDLPGRPAQMDFDVDYVELAKRR